MYNLELFGKHLHRIRKEWKISRLKINELTGIGIETIRSIENGTRFPKFETLESLSMVYKVDLVQLLINYRSEYNILNQKIISFTSQNYNTWDLNLLENSIRYFLESFNSVNPKNETANAINKYLSFFYKAKANNNRFALINSNEIEEMLQTLAKNKSSIFEQPYLFKLEIALSNIYAVILRQENKIEQSINVLLYCEALLRKIDLNDTLSNNLYGAVLVNLTTAYHRLDEEDKVIDTCNNVLSSDLPHFSKHIINGLAFRKIIALYLKDNQDFRINHLITSLLENEDLQRRKTYIEIFKNQYSIEYEFYDFYL